METKLRQTQLDVLRIFSRHAGGFALAGGTALELYYLHHRFSRDLDFFSPGYDLREIDAVIAGIGKEYGRTPVLEQELQVTGKARVRFYSLKIKGTDSALKLDFVEDNLAEKPDIKIIHKVPVYAAEQIYFQKIMAITGVVLLPDATGGEAITGRHEARDIVDVYYLSQKVKPLHEFLATMPDTQRRGIVHWYRRFSRQEFKLDFLDLSVYDQRLSSADIIRHLEQEIKRFMDGMLT